MWWLSGCICGWLVSSNELEPGKMGQCCACWWDKHMTAGRINRVENCADYGFVCWHPNQKWLGIREFVELQFRCLLSLLSNHRILRKSHRRQRTHSRRPSCKCQHWNCVSILFVISCEKTPRPCSLWNWSSFSLWCARVNSLRMISGWIKRRELITKKRFPVVPMYSMCQEAGVCRGSAWNENLESLQADWKSEIISHCDLIPLLEIFLNHS